MKLAKKIKMAMIEQDVTQVELARRTGQNQANLSYKINADNFRINELEELMKAIECEIEVNIILPDGRKI